MEQTDSWNSWKKLSNGDHISDSELDVMIDQIQSALPYLESRLPEYYLVHKDTILTLEKLRRYKIYRQQLKNGV